MLLTCPLLKLAYIVSYRIFWLQLMLCLTFSLTVELGAILEFCNHTGMSTAKLTLSPTDGDIVEIVYQMMFEVHRQCLFLNVYCLSVT